MQEKGWGTKRICSDFSSRECTPAGRVLPVNKSIDQWRDRLRQYFKWTVDTLNNWMALWKNRRYQYISFFFPPMIQWCSIS